jgi:hypothetical protein
MELEVPRGTAYTAIATLFVVVLTFLGWTVTPVDAAGDPLVLSPAYVATMRYLKTAQEWLGALQRVDADLVGTMEGTGNLYRQGRDAERTFERVLTIGREVEQTKTPPSLMALQSAIEQSTSTYVQAAHLLLVYVSAPSEENQQAVTQGLETARTKLETCQTMLEAMWPAR